MKHLDEITKEELNDLIYIMLEKMWKLGEIYGYDKKEMIEYVIKTLKEEI
jgi:hypothetical protein